MKTVMHKHEEKLWFLMFGYLLIDSLGTYFFWSKVGFPHNAVLVIIISVTLLIFGVARSIPPRKEIIAIGLIVFGFIIGVIINDDMGINKLFKVATRSEERRVGKEC